MPETIDDLEQLRVAHKLRAIEKEEQGTTAERLPNGVYGFTYSPAEALPLFTNKTWHNFEVHKYADGSLYLIGFVTPKEADIVRGGGKGEITLFPDPWEESKELVSVPLTRGNASKKGPSREGGNGLKVALM